MIVKKLYRKVKITNWDKKLRTFTDSEVIDYIGWFLFGFIPIYLIEIDRRCGSKYKDKESGEIKEFEFKYGINRQFGHLMRKENAK